jgi:UDP-N-acetylglucosamine--N-acetylmuramyl-(pentapeptide) pyrophosphoryl-undecaprenol N-acetylglucosamine transferase
MKHKNNIRAIISGGGTGGHIFQAIAIANALKEKKPDIEILFVGALGKMEMEKVPASGYKIIGLPVVGLQRKISLRFFVTLFKLMKSLWMARQIVSNFKPDVVVGVGGYASGPVLRVAVNQKIPALIQEQNSFAGITNKLLAPKVNTICVAYAGMEKHFPAQKIRLLGNPVRKDFISLEGKLEEAKKYFGINSGKVVFITGGSLGARSINEAVLAQLDVFLGTDIHVIWQTGKLYLDEMKKRTSGKDMAHIQLMDFISRMDLAYAIADVIVCRAGALTCAELAIAAKPAILVPSPNVAEDHQTKNALALVHKNAALLVKDSDAKQNLVHETLRLLNDGPLKSSIVENIKALAKPNADRDIADEVLKICKK